MSSAAFHRALAQFPIQDQEDLDHAVKNLLKVRDTKPKKGSTDLSDFYPRALALLSYAMNTAAVDGWSTANTKAWGPIAAIARGDLTKRALKLAQKAKRIQTTLANQEFAYDVLWAVAFAQLCRGNHGTARARFNDALTANEYQDGGVTKHRDRNLLADAADAFVYLGRVDVADPFGSQAGRLITDAISAAERRGGAGNAPDWYYWTKAWVTFALAALSSGQARQDYLEDVIAQLEAILPHDPRTTTDFDAYALLAVARYQLGDETNDDAEKDAAADAWDEFIAEVGLKRQVDWTAQKEIDRLSFDTSSGTASTIATYWHQGLRDVEAHNP